VLHVAKMLQFLGEKPEQAKIDADKILALEIQMSVPRLDRVERRDSKNNTTQQQLQIYKKWFLLLIGIPI